MKIRINEKSDRLRVKPQLLVAILAVLRDGQCPFKRTDAKLGKNNSGAKVPENSKNSKIFYILELICMVREAGLEPARP